MLRNLVPHGDKLALVIDKPTLELLKIDADTPLEIATDGKKLTVIPVRDEKRREKLDMALENINRKYGPALKRLAD